MLVEVHAVAPFHKNGFVVACEKTRAAVIIDPGDEVDLLLDAVERHALQVERILLTHAHVDHVTGVPRARSAFDVPLHLHRDDQFLYDAAAQQAAFFGVRCDPLPPIDRHYAPPEVLPLGELQIDVRHTPGHCPGGVCLAAGPRGAAATALFVGDTLFAGSIGRTDLPGGDYDTLLRSIRQVLFGFDDAIVVYPGHGPQTTIGTERRSNPFLR